MRQPLSVRSADTKVGNRLRAR